MVRLRIVFTVFMSVALIALLAALPLATVRAAGAVAATPVFELVDGRLDRVAFARW